MNRRNLAILLFVVGLVAIGLVDYALTVAGYGTLSVVVWIVGYGGLVAIAWYRWVKPLDLRPSGDGA
ncbi:MAG: hypothetical protein ABEI96_07820 [Haloarculaceae archaeon]